MGDHFGQIARLATMIEAREPVWFASASPQAPREGIPAGVVEGGRHAPDVSVGGASLQAVRKDGKARPGRRGARPVEIEEVAIVELEAAPLEAEAELSGKKDGQDGLHVAISQEDGRIESRLDDRHDGMRNRYLRPGSAGFF